MGTARALRQGGPHFFIPARSYHFFMRQIIAKPKTEAMAMVMMMLKA